MEQFQVKSHAKINIGLNVINKRDDGFHDLETIFYPVNIFDTLTFNISDRFSFSSNDAELMRDNENLIVKARKKLEEASGKKLDVKIHLEKRIPIGAGLGGGSSNAASVLLILNRIFDLNLNKSELSKIALGLGSDVPFFLLSVPAFAFSRGERLQPVNLKIDQPILIVNPGIHVSTKHAFSLVTPRNPVKDLKSIINKERILISDLKEFAVNDFEEVVFPDYPEIEDIKNKMIKTGALLSMMTGTGSTVFGIYENRKAAMKAASDFPEHYFTAISD